MNASMMPVLWSTGENNMASLYDLKLNQRGIIQSIKASKNISERLHSFGLINGAQVIYEARAPLGSPRIYKCLNTKIAIRNKTARQIKIL